MVGQNPAFDDGVQAIIADRQPQQHRWVKTQMSRLKSNDLRLTSLALNGCPIDDSAARTLAEGLRHNTACKTLDLSGCGLSHLAVCLISQSLETAMLSSLDLSRNAIEDRSCIVLANTGLRSKSRPAPLGLGLAVLSLADNRITCTGAKAVADTLALCNDSLQALRLSHNEIGEGGGQALARVFMSNRTLKLLHIQKNPISEDGSAVKEMKKCLKLLRGSLVVNHATRLAGGGSGPSIVLSSEFSSSKMLTKTHTTAGLKQMSSEPSLGKDTHSMPQVPKNSKSSQALSASRPGSAPARRTLVGNANSPGSAPARGTIAGTANSNEVTLIRLGRTSADKHSKLASLRCTSKEDFLRFLDRRFGNSVRGWRFALDPEQNNKLSYMQFCATVRSLGFEGPIRALWEDLDADDGGWITLDEVAPGAFAELKNLKDVLAAHYGTCDAAWHKCFAKNGQVLLSEEAFRIAAKQHLEPLGWTGDAKTVYRYLDSDIHGVGHMTIDDLHWLGLPRESSGLSSPSQRRENSPDFAPKKGKDFLELLRSVYGGTVPAWRSLFDPTGQGRLARHNFYSVARATGFEGSVKALWNELSRDGWVSFDELDPEAAKDLRHFRALLESNFQTLEEAWQQGLDKSGLGHLSLSAFSEACRELGYHRDPQRLFRHFSTLENRNGRMHMESLAWLGLPRDSLKGLVKPVGTWRQWL